MFGIGMPEAILILILALIIIGPKKLPDIGKALGKGIREFNKSVAELKEEINITEIQDHLEKESKELKEITNETI